MIYETARRHARQLMQLKRSVPPYLHWRRELQGDPLFDIAAIDRGLLPRPTSESRSAAQRLEVAERIVAAYRLAAEAQAKQSAVYKVSNEWVPVFRRPLRPLLAALESGNAVALRDLLDNFFRNSISEGLCGLAADMAGTFFDKPASRHSRMMLLIDSVYRYRLLERLLPGTTPADLQVADFGNAYGLYAGDDFLRTGVDYQYYYAKQIAAMLEPRQGHRATVVELGGGIGGFAYFLQKAVTPPLTYINLDLPEILCISSYQLLNLLPEKSALLYGESARIDSATVAGHDMALLPSFAVESLDDDSADASFNSYSLAEMDQPTIANYASQLSRVTARAILHVNHVSNSVVSADDFPFDPKKFELVRRERALWNLGRNLVCDEYEFLLTRRLT